MATEFKLPELGENIKTGDVIKVLVSRGDRVEKDQPVIEVETDKAAIEVPSSVAGTVQDLLVKVGDKVQPGQVILRVEGGPPNGGKAAAPAQAKAAEVKAPAPKPAEPKLELTPTPRQMEFPPAAAKAEPAPASSGPAAGPASPSVRRFAREIGADLSQVRGSGAGGRISIEDVKAWAKARLSAPAAAGGAPAARPLPDLAKWGPVRRERLKGVRRATAEHLSHAWSAIPHVTQHDVADITDLDALRQRYAKDYEKSGGKLTITAIALKLCAFALKKFPQFNSSLDMAAGELVYKDYLHIGVAVDTEHGLLVPVIRDVDKKSVRVLAAELAEAARKARERKLALEDMQGGCFTITNLGGIGGTAFTPIVNWPETAILGISRGSTEPVFSQGSFVPRLRMPLSLSYDHRVIDGADAARFLRWLCQAFEQPMTLLLEDML